MSKGSIIIIDELDNYVVIIYIEYFDVVGCFVFAGETDVCHEEGGEHGQLHQ